MKGDNDSCGYRVASYCTQIAQGIDPKKLVDDVKCDTKTIRWIKNILPNIWNGIKNLVHKIIGKKTSKKSFTVTKKSLKEISGSTSKIKGSLVKNDQDNSNEWTMIYDDEYKTLTLEDSTNQTQDPLIKSDQDDLSDWDIVDDLDYSKNTDKESLHEETHKIRH